MEQRLYQAAISEANAALLSEIHEEDREHLVTSYLNASPLHLAALRGNLEFVKRISHQIPELAEAIDSRRRTPLHLASAKGHTNIVKELVSANVDMCTYQDLDGRNPLHVAVMKGHVEIVKVLVAANVDMCTSCDNAGRNPLHVAVLTGNLSVLNELLQACPLAAQARVDRNETVLHLCVKHNQVEALKLLLKNPKSQELVNAKDADGNTILHVAVADANFELVKVLTESKLMIHTNVKNTLGATALDMLQKGEPEVGSNTAILEPNIDRLRMIKKIVLEATKIVKGAVREEWLDKKKESFMVVAALIATVAFQASLSPPGGVWQDNSDGHKAGQTILAYHFPKTYSAFVSSNAVAFLWSVACILLLISDFPIRRYTHIMMLEVTLSLAVFTMSIAYGLVILVTSSQHDAKKTKGGRNVCFIIIFWTGLMTASIVFFRPVRMIMEKHKAKKRMTRSEHTISDPTPEGTV